MIRPRRGKSVRVAPPRGEPIRAHTSAVVTLVTSEWVEVRVRHASWRFPEGTLLLLRRSALLESDGELIAPDLAIVRVYPPEEQNEMYAVRAMENVLRSGESEHPDAD